MYLSPKGKKSGTKSILQRWRIHGMPLDFPNAAGPPVARPVPYGSNLAYNKTDIYDKMKPRFEPPPCSANRAYVSWMGSAVNIPPWYIASGATGAGGVISASSRAR